MEAEGVVPVGVYVLLSWLHCSAVAIDEVISRRCSYRAGASKETA